MASLLTHSLTAVAAAAAAATSLYTLARSHGLPSRMPSLLAYQGVLRQEHEGNGWLRYRSNHWAGKRLLQSRQHRVVDRGRQRPPLAPCNAFRCVPNPI